MRLGPVHSFWPRSERHNLRKLNPTRNSSMSQKPVETLIDDFPSVNGSEGHCVAMATDGPSSSPSKRKGWIASLFGSTSSNSSQETEETDSAKKQEQSHKEEHITVPAKGNCASSRVHTPLKS